MIFGLPLLLDGLCNLIQDVVPLCSSSASQPPALCLHVPLLGSPVAVLFHLPNLSSDISTSRRSRRPLVAGHTLPPLALFCFLQETYKSALPLDPLVCWCVSVLPDINSMGLQTCLVLLLANTLNSSKHMAGALKGLCPPPGSLGVSQAAPTGL